MVISEKPFETIFLLGSEIGGIFFSSNINDIVLSSFFPSTKSNHSNISSGKMNLKNDGSFFIYHYYIRFNWKYPDTFHLIQIDAEHQDFRGGGLTIDIRPGKINTIIENINPLDKIIGSEYEDLPVIADDIMAEKIMGISTEARKSDEKNQGHHKLTLSGTAKTFELFVAPKPEVTPIIIK